MNNLGLYVLAAAVVLVGILGVTRDPVAVNVTSSDGEVQVVQPSLGASPGPDVYNHTYFHEGLTYGGDGCFSTSTTGVLTDSMLEKIGCIYVSATGAGQGTLSLTLVSSSTNLVSEAGQCRDWWIDASDVAAGTTTTFVAGTGVDVVGLDATGAGTGADVIDGAEFGRLTLCRQSPTNRLTAFVQEYIHAD